MNQKLTVNYENKPAYDILIESDFSLLADALENLGLKGRRIMIITDTNVSKYYLHELKNSLKKLSNIIESFIFEAGEGSKNLDTVSNCYEKLIQSGFDRNDYLIALGGGVVGDLTGFAAATFLRGIRFIQVPTSLLSMVDSSIGGKTGVDFKAYKNMVGAFHQPKLVYMNLSVINSLPDREFYSGMAEIIKHGLIKDIQYYNWLKEHMDDIKKKDLDSLAQMILKSCEIKKAVVEEDPKELGDRALLNFGHTIGHSIERLKDFSLLHGECVSIGMAAAAYLSMNKGFISKEEYNDILTVIENYHQPIRTDGLSSDHVYEITKLDKKMDMGKIKFILLQGIGHAVIDRTLTQDEIIKAAQSVLE